MTRPLYTLTRIVLTSIALTSCTGIPDGVEPVSNFKLERYLGTWYEIARLDHSFERGLTQVSAEYRLRDDGGIDVVNRGYHADQKKWSEALGKAYFIGDKNIAHLKVSFFGPFYASYIVFELGENYDYAFISGNSKDYLWLLARKPVVDQAVLDLFFASAKQRGFNVEEVILVQQEPTMNSGSPP